MEHHHGLIAAAGCLAAALACSQACSPVTRDYGNGHGGSSGTGASATHGASASGTGAGGSGSGSGSTGSGGSMFPAPPVARGQIDRMGRPAVNTAVNHTFDTDAAAKGAGKDTWNQNGDPSQWQAAHAAEVGKNLAIIDALDTKCGNQIFADSTKTDPSRYALLAGVLAADVLYVDTSASTCSQYLAVEGKATGLFPSTDCGGRKLDYDVIDTTYSLLTIGSVSGVTDGVSADADTKGTTFPYLAAPH